jgi:hypothetical protein
MDGAVRGHDKLSPQYLSPSADTTLFFLSILVGGDFNIYIGSHTTGSYHTSAHGYWIARLACSMILPFFDRWLFYHSFQVF